MTLTKTTAGLLLADDFASLSAWTNGGVWTSVADPLLVVFDPSSVGGLTGTIGGPDNFGCRQGTILVEGSTWYNVHEGWDGTNPILQQMATTLDGITWTKESGNLVGTQDGAGGNWSGTATGWIAKFGSLYYLYRVIQSSGGSFPLNAAGPYYGDVWSTPGPPSTSATWTFVGSLGLFAGTWAASELLPGSVYFDGTTYHLFGQGAASGGLYAIGRLHSTSPGGPWTIDSTVICDSTRLGDSRHPENPKVFFHAGLNRYCLLSNLIDAAGTATDQNLLMLSTSLTDWSAATLHRIQHVSPLDSPGAVGVLTHFTGPDNALIAESDGSVPAVFDGLGNTAPGYHLNRTIRSTVLEPSAATARYTDAGTTPHRITQALAHANFTAEYACEFRAFDVTNGALDFEFRRTDDNNHYVLSLNGTFGLILYKVVSGSATSLGHLSSPTQGPNVNLVHRVRLVCVGSSIQAWLDGEQQINLTDTTYGSGVSIAFRATDLDGDIRRFHMRTSQTITVTGVPVGVPVVIRSAGSVPFAQGVGPTVALSVPHAPNVSLQIGAIVYTPPGGIHGGDSYAYADIKDALAWPFA